VHTTARMRSRGREMLDRAADVVAFYAGLVGEAPFPTFSLVGPREPHPRRPQPGVLRGAQPAAADLPVHVARRPGLVRELSRVLPGARDRAPVVGAGRRVEELPRAVAQRGVRAVLRGALRRAPPRPRRVRRRDPVDEPLGGQRVAAGAGLPRLPAGSPAQRRARLPRARLQQGRHGAAHDAPADRRRDVLPRAAPLLRHPPVHEGGHRRPAAGVRGGDRPRLVGLLRAVDLRVRAPAALEHLARAGAPAGIGGWSSASSSTAAPSSSRSPSPCSSPTARRATRWWPCGPPRWSTASRWTAPFAPCTSIATAGCSMLRE
jgi:hypothetical protein